MPSPWCGKRWVFWSGISRFPHASRRARSFERTAFRSRLRRFGRFFLMQSCIATTPTLAGVSRWRCLTTGWRSEAWGVYPTGSPPNRLADRTCPSRAIRSSPRCSTEPGQWRSGDGVPTASSTSAVVTVRKCRPSRNRVVTVTFGAAIVPQVAPEVTPQAIPEVAPQVYNLLKKLHQPMTRHELQRVFKLKDQKNFRRNYLQPALDAGLIAMSNPESPNAPNQKYVLTEAGRRHLDVSSQTHP